MWNWTSTQSFRPMVEAISLREPYLIMPQRSDFGHLSLPKIGILCGRRSTWSSPKKYHLDKVDIGDFDVCDECKIGLYNEDQDRFDELFGSDTRERVEQLKEKLEDRKEEDTHDYNHTPDKVEWNIAPEEKIRMAPSNVTNEFKKSVFGGYIRGYQYTDATDIGPNERTKRKFQITGKWRGWYIFDYQIYLHDDGSTVMGRVEAIHESTLQDSDRIYLNGKLKNPDWIEARTI